MPVRRFHSAEEMNAPFWYEPGDPRLYRAIRAVWELGHRLHPARRFPPGVHRSRTIEQAAARTAAWDAANFAAFQRWRRGVSTSGSDAP